MHPQEVLNKIAECQKTANPDFVYQITLVNLKAWLTSHPENQEQTSTPQE